VLAVIGGTIGASRKALYDGISVNLAGGTHHAFADHGEGYCIFNDFVIAVRRVRSERLAEKFLIVDLDVHQGNGTAALCREDPNVFTFSMHGENNYPLHKERGSWDIALADGTHDEFYLETLVNSLASLKKRFSPDLILYQAGVDVLSGDRFGKLALTMLGVAERDRLVCEYALGLGVPLVITLGGGYARQINRIAEAHCQTIRIAKRVHSGSHL
jgi:acetoin utilization deacetylase AcuC-like enzyme